MINKSIFLIITFIFHTLSLSSQIVNVDSKRQSEEKGLSGITEFTFDFNKSVQTDWEFSNITYLQWDNEKWSVLLLNETNLEEEITNETINDIRINSSLQIKFDFGKKLSLSTTTYYQPSTKNLKDSKSSNETILLINLNDRLSISNTLSTNYDTNPAKDIPNLIYSFENGVVYSF